MENLLRLIYALNLPDLKRNLDMLSLALVVKFSYWKRKGCPDYQRNKLYFEK